MTRKTCPVCYGMGSQQDIASGIALGTALGTGYFPQTRICLNCSGTGSVEDK